MSDFQIVPSVGLWQLNPMNHALRNDYIENLMHLAVVVLPDLYAKYGSVNVVEGFVSKSLIDANDLFRNKKCSGNCISVNRWTIPDSELIEGLKDILINKPLPLTFVLVKDKIIIIKALNIFSSIERIDNDKLITLWKK